MAWQRASRLVRPSSPAAAPAPAPTATAAAADNVKRRQEDATRDRVVRGSCIFFFFFFYFGVAEGRRVWGRGRGREGGEILAVE